jgi:hypothetical protein
MMPLLTMALASILWLAMRQPQAVALRRAMGDHIRRFRRDRRA